MGYTKFRGKRLDNGEWVYGYYFRHMDKHKIHVLDGVVSEVYSVDPATIGQLRATKSDGAEVFEGDVLARRGHWAMVVEHHRVYPLDKVQRMGAKGIPIDEFDFNMWTVSGTIHDDESEVIDHDPT